MNAWPTTSDARLRLALFSLKACIVGVPLIGTLLVGIATFGGWNDQYGTRGIVEKTLAGLYTTLGYGPQAASQHCLWPLSGCVTDPCGVLR